MNKHIQELLVRGEGERLDYKQSISDAGKIAKTMCAFANHKGGTLLIGVRDNKTIAGVRSEDEKYMLGLAASFHCKPEINILINEWDIDGKTVLECLIPEGADKPYYAKDEAGKWWAYIRVKDHSLLASKIVLDVLKRQNSDEGTLIEYTSKEKALLDYLNENERINLSEFRQMLNLGKWRASNIIVNLITAGIIRSHTTEKMEYYTLA
jgi:predicted HTH transcriptional regulator